MTDIVQIRNKINEIDNEIIELLAEREKAILQVAEYKYDNGIPVKDKEREEAHLKEMLDRAVQKGVSTQLVADLVNSIYKTSVAKQISYINGLYCTKGLGNNDIKVSFLGNKGTYSHLATYKYFSAFKNKIIERNCKSFDEIVNAVENEEVTCGIIPIENTSSGCINEVYDILQDAKVYIIGELTLPIDHCLLTAVPTDLSQIEEVYSHPQPISQCLIWLHNNLPNVKFKACSSTAEAMEIVENLQSPKVVAIGSEMGGEIFNEKPLYRNIANQKVNVTRFIVIGKSKIIVPENVIAKTTLIFTTENKPGSLVKVLSIFSKNNINISKLQSRPRSPSSLERNTIWAETFYIDIMVNSESLLMQNILLELKEVTGYVRVLGCYVADTVEGCKG
ncbi:MAG: prephenate dehydratase domain-containing protein [Succinivibrionaceae bacterium]